MKLSKNTIGLIIAAIIPLGLEFIFGKNLLGESSIMYSILWLLVNYLFLMTSYEFIKGFMKINSLENVKLSKSPYILNIIIYVGFLVFVNIYFLQQMYVRDVEIINFLANPLFIVLLFVLFLFNLQNGKFPNVDDKETTIYSIAKNSGFRDGKDRFNTVIGSYEDGLIAGNQYFPFENMKSVSKTKENEIVVKGKEKDKNYILNIGSENSVKAAREVFLNAAKDNKIEKGKVNIK